MTEYKFEGSLYRETQKLDLKEIAKRIKGEVLKKYPNIGVSVTSEYFANGCAIRIHVKSYPRPIYQKGPYGQEHTAEVKELLSWIQAIANQYRYDDSDSMFDHFDTNFYCTPQIDHLAFERFQGKAQKPQKPRKAPAGPTAPKRAPKPERVERRNGVKPLPPETTVRSPGFVAMESAERCEYARLHLTPTQISHLAADGD